MPIVYRINSKTGDKTRIFISDALWNRMKKKPVKGQFRFELIPQPKSPIYSGIPKSSTQAEVFVNDDLTDVKPVEISKYTEENYREDLKNAGLCLKLKDKENALIIYQRAYEFKKSPYVYKKIKELS